MLLQNDYNFTERLLHAIAFSAPILQRMLAEYENDIYRSEIDNVHTSNEVFIAGLPRSGTTLLLNLIYGTGEFATFTYRQMPFILIPLLWNKLTYRYQKEGQVRERAHGDGVKISFDSPEAFEEVIWLTYMKKKIIKSNYISPLSEGEYSQEFAHAIVNAAKKCIILKKEKDNSINTSRYISKNNANISRIEVIKELFPTSKMLVPFRHPLSQINSLMKQHNRFLRVHEKDKFSKKYMRWLGHFEFGENFKPINYDSWVDNKKIESNIDYDYWIAYWTAAYAHVLKHKGDNVILVDYDDMLTNREVNLNRIAEQIGLTDKNKLIEKAGILRNPTTDGISHNLCSKKKLNCANMVYKELKDSII